MMNQSADPSKNRINYTSAIDCVAKSVQLEGTNALFVGLIPHFVKVFAYGILVACVDRRLSI